MPKNNKLAQWTNYHQTCSILWKINSSVRSLFNKRKSHSTHPSQTKSCFFSLNTKAKQSKANKKSKNGWNLIPYWFEYAAEWFHSFAIIPAAHSFSCQMSSKCITLDYTKLRYGAESFLYFCFVYIRATTTEKSTPTTQTIIQKWAYGAYTKKHKRSSSLKYTKNVRGRKNHYESVYCKYASVICTNFDEWMEHTTIENLISVLNKLVSFRGGSFGRWRSSHIKHRFREKKNKWEEIVHGNLCDTQGSSNQWTQNRQRIDNKPQTKFCWPQIPVPIYYYRFGLAWFRRFSYSYLPTSCCPSAVHFFCFMLIG